ncbi:MAG: hypothetical protein KAR19_03840 [Bacteroidales bacterium]|nr:hypothetical protein [Bacteroidales bacterium]
MKLISILAFLFLLPAWSHAHPLHLSITNIAYENGMLMVSMKTFRDDWETAYFHYHSQVVDFTDQPPQAIPWFEDYLNNRFWLSLNEGDQKLSLEIDTVILNEDSMIIEMHSTAPGEPNSLYIYNALLTDIYPDQTNLVIFMFKNKESGIKFDMRKHDAEVTLN